MSAEKPKALGLPSAPPRPTAPVRPLFAQTLLGHTAPAPPEVTAWLNALLKLDAKPATPLGEAMNVAHSSPTVPAFPAVVDDPEPADAQAALEAQWFKDETPEGVPDLPEAALEAEPPAPPPQLAAPVAAPIAPPAAALPPPIPLEAIPEISAPTAASSGPATRLSVDHQTDAPSAAGAGRGRFVALALVAAAALGAALFVKSRHAPAPPPPAPAAVEMAVAPQAPPPEAVPPPEPEAPAPPAHVEIGLDPAAAATPPAPTGEEKAREEKPEDEQPRPARRERPAAPPAGDRSAVARGNALLKDGDATGAIAAFAEAIRQAPESPEGYRGLGLAHEKRGNAAEAMDAFKSYIKLATRSRDREWAARHMYTLAHPDEE